MAAEINRAIQSEITIDHAIAVLNEAVEKDREAMRALIFNHVPCNDALADHPTIQVKDRNGETSVGFLGVLNGLFGIAPDGCGAIAAEFELICANGHVPDSNVVYGDPCPVCGAQIGLGRLLRFAQVRQPGQ